MVHGIAWLMSCWCLAGLAVGQTKAIPVPPKLKELTAPMDAMTSVFGLTGAALLVGQRTAIVHQSEHGAVGINTVLPIAEAGIWLAVATILTLVDEQLLDLDLPISRYLPEFDTPEKRRVTLRLCLACTAGLPPQMHAAGDANQTLDALVAEIAKLPLRGDPGLQWETSSITFEVAAAAAVRVAGSDWHTLFRQRIAGPLGLQDTNFGGPQPVGLAAAFVPATLVSGMAVSTLRDYARFMQMLALDGEFGGVRVLTKKSVDLMFQSMTTGMKVRTRAIDDATLAYGLGTWLQAVSMQAVRGSDPGAFGFTPWLDRDLGLFGVLAVSDRVQRILPRAQMIMTVARNLAVSPKVAGSDLTVQIEHGGRTRRYLLHMPNNAAKAERLPLLFVLHGGGGSGPQAAFATGFSPIADRLNFCVVYPDGTGPFRGRLLTWNSGGIPVYASDENVDDVGFLRAVIASVKEKIAVDPERITATGISNGAMMCHRLAREAADIFAAIAPVSGAMDFTAADSKIPIAVMIVHGTADEHVRYLGGRPSAGFGRAALRVDASVADATRYYLQRNGLAAEPVRSGEGKVKFDTWQLAAQDGATPPPPLVLVTLEGGKHAWPSGVRGDYVGADEPFDWQASVQIWQFLSAQRRRVR